MHIARLQTRKATDVRCAMRAIMNVRSIGFALNRSWVYLMFLNTASLLFMASGGSWITYANIASTITLTITLFALAAFGRPSAMQRHSKRTFALAAGITCGGTACIVASGIAGGLAIPLGIVGGVLTGVGSGVIDMGYGELYSRLESSKTNFEVPFAFFLAATFFSLTMQLPPYFAAIACSLIPIVAALLLVTAMDTASPTSKADPKAQIDIIPFTWRIGACSCLVGIGDGIVRAACLATPGLSTQEFYTLPLVAGSVATMAIIYLCCLITPPEQGEGLCKVYRSSVFVMAAFYLLLPLIQGFHFLESTMALTGYGTFNVLIWLLLAETAHRHKLAPHVIYGIGWGMVTFGVLIGGIAGQLLIAQQPSMSVVSLVATLCILTSYLFVLKEHEFATMVTPVVQGPSPEASGSAEATTAGEVSSGDSAEDANRPRKARFMDRCTAVAEAYGLTPRETELMILYAKGHTSANIQQELFLSRGTVTTHLRHIYQKMEIHSKAELMELIDHCSPDGQ